MLFCPFPHITPLQNQLSDYWFVSNVLITKHMLNSARNEIPLTQLLNSCYYYSGREAAKYSTDPHMSGHSHGVAPYKEDPCSGLGQWGTVGVERT